MSEPSATVIVVDDEEPMRQIIAERLEREGHTIVEAANAEEALECFEKHDCCAAIVDIRLPGMDGIELTRRVKSASPDTMVIIVTGFGDVDVTVRALRAGAEDFILKPFNMDALALTVDRALNKRQLIIENRSHQQELEKRVERATHELDEVNRELRRTGDRLQNIFDSSPDAIISTTARGRIAFFSKGAEEMLGYSEEEVHGRSAHTLCGDGMDDVRRIMKGLQARGRVLNYAVDLVRNDGTRVPASMSVSLLHSSDGAVDGTISISKDMTEQRELERNLRELSIRDSLSDLYNRRYFRERLTSELARARRQGHTMSVLLFDIDDFKLYNDTHGHVAGDKMLEQLGAIVRECIRDDVDIPFRYGGDEFTVLLVETSPEQAYDVAERIRVSFSKFTRAEITLSIGMLARAEGMDEEAIVREVDRRMYRAKRAGGDRIAE